MILLWGLVRWFAHGLVTLHRLMETGPGWRVDELLCEDCDRTFYRR